MMARAIAAALAVELALYVAAGWVARGHGVSLAVSALVALAVFLGLRLAFVAWLWVQTRRARAAQSAPLWVVGGARWLLSELWALLDIYLFGLLTQPWLAPRDPVQIAPGVPPVVFVHGILCNAGVWHRSLAALERAGVQNLFTLNLEPPGESIDRFAAQLAGRVEEACRATGATRAIIVGHSMGGLVARAWSARLGGTSRAAALVTIGTPHHGSKLARGLRGQAWAPELRHGSRWLEALQAQEAGSARVPITSIYSWHDEFLVPQDSPCVTGARNIALERLGHLALLGSPQVHALLAAEIAAARAACPS